MNEARQRTDAQSASGQTRESQGVSDVLLSEARCFLTVVALLDRGGKGAISTSRSFRATTPGVPSPMNRRGNIFDNIGILFTVFSIVILCFVAVYFINGFNDGIQSIVGIPSTASTISSNVDSDIGWVLDFFVIMMLITMPLLSMVLAFFNNIHPFFFWASIGISMIVIIIASAFGDAFTAFINSGNIGTVASQMPMSSFVFQNLAIYAFLSIMMIAGGVFVKGRSAGGYGP